MTGHGRRSNRSPRSVVGGLVGSGLLLVVLLTGAAWSVLNWPKGVFGGFSGLEVSADGARLDILSDRGFLVQARLLRAAPEQVPAGISLTGMSWLARPDGRSTRLGGADSEGLAWTGQGHFAISMEMGHSLWSYGQHGTARQIPPPPGTESLPRNRRYEALAVDPSGRPVMTPEGTPAGETGHPLWRLGSDGQWQRIGTLAASSWHQGGFRPVGADFAPDGSLYILERGISLSGFRSRVLQLEAPDEEASDQPSTGKVVWQSHAYPLTNFEGIALWQDASGKTRLLLVSDDNFLPFLTSSLLEITLAPGGPQESLLPLVPPEPATGIQLPQK